MQQRAAAIIQGALSADDRLDIHQLISAEYFLYEDAGRFEPWADLFTADASFFPHNKEPVFGRANLVAFAKERWESRPEVRSWVHCVTNVAIWPTAGGAEAHSIQMTIEKVGFRIVLISQKSDELRREDGRWRFHVRRALPLNVY